jgi:sugar phosphate permease
VGKALGVMSSGIGASGLIVPFIVWLIDVFQWRTALIILGIGMWILGIPFSLLIRNKPVEPSFSSNETVPNDLFLQHEIQRKNVETSLKEALKTRSFLYLNFIEAIRFMIVAAVATHIMPYLSTTGMPRQKAGLVAAALPLFSIMGRVGFGWLSDIFEKKYVMAVSFLLMAGGMIGFCHVGIKWVILIFLLLFSPGFGGGVVLRGAILKEYFGRGYFGKMFGIVTGSASIGGIIGPTLAGWGFDTWGSYSFVWLASFGLMCIAIILILKMEHTKNR